MKKIIALVSVLVLCMACVSTAFATVTEFEYDIVAGKDGYGPSSIYTSSGEVGKSRQREGLDGCWLCSMVKQRTP